MNIKVVHEKGKSTQLNFLGFKINTNMTIRPIIDIFKGLVQFDITNESMNYKNKILDASLENFKVKKIKNRLGINASSHKLNDF